MQTTDFSKHSLRQLKLMRKYHRRLRANPLHRNALEVVNKLIAKRKDK